jgi:hypothetical protein
MANFKISGVWKTKEGTITHYAIHKVESYSVSRASKTTKAAAVQLLNIEGNTAVTWLWDYSIANWKNGAAVEVVKDFLRTIHDNKVSDNLAHLLDYDWLA